MTSWSITAIVDRVSNKKTAKTKTMKEEEHPLAEEVHHHEVEHQVAKNKIGESSFRC